MEKNTQVPPSRQGKKQIAGFFDPEIQTALKQIALDEDSSVQQLLKEGINHIFKKRGINKSCK